MRLPTGAIWGDEALSARIFGNQFSHLGASFEGSRGDEGGLKLLVLVSGRQWQSQTT